MEEDIKKKLTKNWFKILQDMICNEIEELENKRTRVSEIEAHNNASLMMRNAGYPIDTCLKELKFTARLSGYGANTEPKDSHPGYEEWVSKLEEFIASQKDTEIVNTSKTDSRWRYDRDLNVLVMTPIN